MKNVFWGLGLSAKINLDFWTSVKKVPDFFCCNSPKTWGSFFNKILVISPKQLRKIIQTEEVRVYITSYAYTQIKDQLILLGLDRTHIIRSQYPYHFFYQKEYDYLWNISLANKRIKRDKKFGYLFDLYAGTVLAGSQSWVYYQQKLLQKNGIEVSTLLASDVIYNKEILKAHATIIERSIEKGYYEGVLSYLLNCDLNSFVNVDTCESFVASCKAKQVLGDSFKNIVVVHADYEPYYYSYGYFEHYIDVFFVISKKIKQKLLNKGVPENKLRMLEWTVDFNFAMRSYSKNGFKLQITYFGRLAIFQKRCDLLICLVKKLKELRVNFKLNIAGHGEYSFDLKSCLKQDDLDRYVNFVGEVSSCDVESFLEKQDIFVNCSEFEGHSISQYEAIACGCVPVITDVSGAIDDIYDGYNGFIVDQGDIETMAKRIKELDDDRALLEIMGLRGRLEIIKRNFHENAFLSYVKDNYSIR